MMEVRWGATGGTNSSCRPNLVMATPCATSGLYFLAAERPSLASQRTSALLDQRRSASAAAHCSTSGTSNAPVLRIPGLWGKSSYHESKRRGKCNFASENSVSGQTSVADSVADSVAVMESVLDVMEWRSRSTQQLQDPNRDSEEDNKSQIDPANSEEDNKSQIDPVNAVEVELESAEFDETKSGLGSLLEEPLRKEEQEGPEKDGRQRGELPGWRGLASGEGVPKLGKSKAFLLNRPWRKSKARRQRFKSADNFASTSLPKEEKKLVTIMKECIRDWPDDGQSYLALGLVALPLNNDPFNRMDGNMAGELKGKNVSGLDKNGLFPGDYLMYEDIVDGAINARGTLPGSPAISEMERLKINLDLQLYHAKCLKQKGRRDASETVLRKCIKDWPDEGRSYVALGKLLLEQNKIQDARTVYDSGCQAVRGENPYIWQAWAMLEEKCGDISKARKLFDAAIVADKKHVSAWHGWANLELRAGNVRRARSLLNKALKFCGPNEYVFQTLALLELRGGTVEEARSLLTKATKHNPKSAASWLAWALLEAEHNFPDTARRLFQKALEASPKNRYVWQAWARFEAKQGREERARELFQRGRELNPKDVVLLQAFALFEYACGRPGVARDIFRRAASCNSRHQPVWNGWAWMEWKEGNLSVARELYQGAIQVNSTSMDAARAFQAWGVLEDRDGDTGLARELFKAALKIDSQNVPTWMSWAAMEEREGRSVRADEIRNEYLRQRTEVVEASWDVDFSEILAPAIDRIKGFFKGRRRSSSSRSGPNPGDLNKDLSPTGNNEGVNASAEVPAADLSSNDAEFDIDRFLKKKFPFRYGFLDESKSSFSISAQEPQNDRV